MMKYKFILLAIVALFICGKSSINAQTPTERGKFEVSIYENFLHGTYDLMGYTGANFEKYLNQRIVAPKQQSPPKKGKFYEMAVKQVV